MKKYILIIILTISIVLGISLSVNKIIILQASGTVYPPDYISVRVRDSALDVSWRHNPDNLSVDNYKVYYNTVSGDRTNSLYGISKFPLIYVSSPQGERMEVRGLSSSSLIVLITRQGLPDLAIAFLITSW